MARPKYYNTRKRTAAEAAAAAATTPSATAQPSMVPLTIQSCIAIICGLHFKLSGCAYENGLGPEYCAVNQAILKADYTPGDRQWLIECHNTINRIKHTKQLASKQ